MKGEREERTREYVNHVHQLQIYDKKLLNKIDDLEKKTCGLRKFTESIVAEKNKLVTQAIKEDSRFK